MGVYRQPSYSPLLGPAHSHRRIRTHLHRVQVEDRVPNNLPGAVVRDLPSTLCDEELCADVLYLAFLWMQRIRIRRVIPPSRGIRRCMLCMRRQLGRSQGDIEGGGERHTQEQDDIVLASAFGFTFQPEVYQIVLQLQADRVR